MNIFSEATTYFLDAIKNKYADFDGRARRKEYWLYQLCVALAVIAVYIVAIALAFASPKLMLVVMGLLGLASLAILVPSLALAVRRMHDLGKSGWWILITFVPVIGSIWFLILTITEGVRGDNEYGPDPKAGE